MIKQNLSLFLLFFILSGLVHSATIHVPQDYSKIQDAINASVDRDLILVSPGIYKENLFIYKKGIFIKSLMGPESTIIDGGSPGNPDLGSVVRMIQIASAPVWIEGFTLMNGTGTKIKWTSYGGGIYSNQVSMPLYILNNRILSCGGAQIVGGGVYLCDSGNFYIEKNKIIDNSNTGVFCEVSNGSIKKNIIQDNMSSGMKLTYGNYIIENNMIAENMASNGEGGGLLCEYSVLDMKHNTFCRNTADSGGAIYAYYQCSLELANTIFWDNKASNGPEIYLWNSSGANHLSISYSNVKGGQASVFNELGLATVDWGAGMIDSDPLFVDISKKDYHLTWQSPCRGSGGIVYVHSDFEGDARPFKVIPDMGADEFHRHLYIMGNELKLIGQPGASPAIIWVSEEKLLPPIKSIYGFWYLKPPILLTAVLGQIPSNGVLTLTCNPPFPKLVIQAGAGNELTNAFLIE